MDTVKFKNSIMPIIGLVCIAITILIAATLLTSCNSPAQQVEAAQEDVVDAKEDLNEANEDYLTEIEDFRQESAVEIRANDESIATFNTRIANEKNDVREEYKEKIAELERKNTDVKKRLDEYKADGEYNWDNFKREFSRDMDAIGKDLKDLTGNEDLTVSVR